MKNNMNEIKDILVQLNYILSKKQKRNSVLVFGCMIICSGLELLGVSALYPFLQMMLETESLKTEWYLIWIYRLWPDIEAGSVILFIGIMIILIYIVKNLFMIFAHYMQYAFAARFEREVSTLMLKAYMNQKYQFFLKTNSSDIIRGIGTDINGVYNVILNIFSLLSETLTIVLLGVYLLLTDVVMALGALILALFCLLSVILGFKGKMKSAGVEARIADSNKVKCAYQAIMGIKEIKVSNRVSDFVEKYENAAISYERASLTNSFLNACPDRILEGICIGGFMGIACVRVAMGTDISTFIPVLGTFAMAAFKVLPSVSKVSTKINSLIFYRQRLQSTYDNLKASNEYVKFIEDCQENRCKGICKKEREKSFKNILEVKDIKWKYENSNIDVLNNLSITVNKGESIAFIGPSGAGKTTLADVLMGLLKPYKGTVEMDGIDIFSISNDWARIIGYVPQSVFLVDDTVRNNVAFGINEEDVLDEKVWNALEQAQLKDFIQQLPDGLNTVVGERGVKFSGGQRQRMAIARALYENPDILVLDEATSALDNETETAVMDAIEALQGSKTLIIVAHRLSTIRNCDRIYEIKDGIAKICSKDEIVI